MNKSKLTTGALLVVLLLLAGGCFLIFGDSLGLAAYANADKYTVGDADISSAVENLEIDWISGKVNIQYSQIINILGTSPRMRNSAGGWMVKPCGSNLPHQSCSLSTTCRKP